MSQDSPQYEARGHRADTPLSISQLNWYIKNVLEEAVPNVWVEGEVSDLSRPSSGHYYFSLKDDRSQVRAVIWRSTAQQLKFQIKDGQSLVCCGPIEVYPPRGSYQLIVNRVQPKGVGALQLAFQQLHEKLNRQGLFDAIHKQSLPRFPKRIGVITSPSGAALHDFLETARQLWSDFRLTIIPARVQGEQAAADIVRGIRHAQAMAPPLDVLVLCRGGGSIEDLWCFNDERVVRAIHQCKIPTISAIGHEVDVTLSDLVADVRCHTPTHAAQMVFPNRTEIRSNLTQLRHRLHSQLVNRIENQRMRLRSFADRSLLGRPHDLHLIRRQTIDELEHRIKTAVDKLLMSKKEKLQGIARATEALSPLNVLSRGYSLTCHSTGQDPVRSVDQLEPGDSIETKVTDGTIHSTVDSIHRNEDR